MAVGQGERQGLGLGEGGRRCGQRHEVGQPRGESHRRLQAVELAHVDLDGGVDGQSQRHLEPVDLRLPRLHGADELVVGPEQILARLVQLDLRQAAGLAEELRAPVVVGEPLPVLLQGDHPLRGLQQAVVAGGHLDRVVLAETLEAVDGVDQVAFRLRQGLHGDQAA